MPQKQKASIMDADGMRRAIHRISYEILEKNRGARDIVLVGIVRRGAVVAERIADKIFDVEGIRPPVVRLDITPWRDDRKSTQACAGDGFEGAVEVEGATVILVDDVLYTGRTVRALIDAGAFSPESAAGASALGLKGASARVLRGQLYGKLIFCPNEYYARTVPYDPEKENPYKTPALDMDKAVFYIPEEKKFEAEERFCSRTSPVWSIILYALLLGAAFAALSFAAPKLIGAFTSVFNR